MIKFVCFFCRGRNESGSYIKDTFVDDNIGRTGFTDEINSPQHSRDACLEGIHASLIQCNMLVKDLDKLQSKEIDKAAEKELNEKVTEDSPTVMETNGSSELRTDLSDDVVSEFCNDLPVDFVVEMELTSSVDRSDGLSVDAASVRELSRSPELNENASILACNDGKESNDPVEFVKDIPVITCNDKDEFSVSVELIEDLCINDDVRSDSEAPRMIDFRKCLSQSDMTNVTIPAGTGSSIEGHCRSLENVSCSAAAQLNREPHLAPSPLTVLTELVTPNSSENMLNNSSKCKMISSPMETIIYKSEVPPISVYKYRPIAVKDYFTVSSNDIASAGKSDIPHCSNDQLESADKSDIPHCSSGQLASAGKYDIPHTTNSDCKNVALKDSNQNIVSSVCNVLLPNQFFTSSGNFNSAHYLPTRPLSQICMPSEGMSLPEI